MAASGYYKYRTNSNQNSFAYKIVVLIAGAFLIFVMVLLFNGVENIRAERAFSDERVVAFSGGKGNAWAEITIGYLIFSAFFVIGAMSDKFPKNQTSGRKKVKRTRTNTVSPQVAKNRRVIFFVWLGVLVALIVCSVCFGIDGRECLYDDGSIHVFNSVSREIAVYDVDDMEKVELNLRRLASGRHSHRWTFGIEFYTSDGESFWYEYSDFAPVGLTLTDSGIGGMTMMKQIYADVPLEIIGKENFQAVVDYLEMYPAFAQQLGVLFEIETADETTQEQP